jgi:hypothetical protein
MHSRAHAVASLCLVTALAGVALGTGCSAKSAAPADAAAPTQQQYQPGYPQGDATTGAAPTAAIQNPFATGPDAMSELDRAEHDFENAVTGKDSMGQPLSAGTDTCQTVCKALASMRNAADHVCELAKDRCDDAKSRVTRAENRAKESCPLCAAPT